MADEVALCLDDLVTSSSIPQCRICHEDEAESSKSLETPCSCSGTLKFAHRECIQRWCNEKGNTTCEICLQNFESGYTVPKKARLADVAVTIRESLEVPRQYNDLRRPGFIAISATEAEIIEASHDECSSASERSASCCRSMAVIFTILLLARHLLAILGGTDHYAFTLLTVILFRASGIILPLYIMIRIMEAIQRWKCRLQQHHELDTSTMEESEEEEEQLYTVDIH